MTTSTELSSKGILLSMSPFLNSTFVKPLSIEAYMALFNISSVKSIPITLPVWFILFEARKTSIPAPEPKSTTVSPTFKSAKLRGAPQLLQELIDLVMILYLGYHIL